MQLRNEARDWSRETFGGAELGDRRRVDRLVRIAMLSAMHPSGKVSEVFVEDADRQGAYDFIASPQVRSAAITKAMGCSTAARCADEARVYVSIDGSSVTLTDRGGEKDFGAVGDYVHGARGLKVISALAMNTQQGVPIGLLAQTWWKRPTRKSRRKPSAKRARSVAQKETQRWLDTFDAARATLREGAPDTRACFVVDREGDSAAMLLSLASPANDFIVRANWDRQLRAPKGQRQLLRRVLGYQPLLGAYALDIAAGPGRSARTGHIEVRAKRVELVLKDPWTGERRVLEVSAVWAREIGTAPKGETPVDWLLYTNLNACRRVSRSA